MAKDKQKKLRYDEDGIQLTMGLGQYCSYGMGVMGLTIVGAVLAQLTYFYTDKVGLAPALAGSVLLITKIADAFSDIIMGRIVDKTNTKWGKARPWMLWMALPAFLSVVMLLTVPSGLSSYGKFIYALISNILSSAVIVTAIGIPYSCLVNYRTGSRVERQKMGVYRTVFNFFTSILLNVMFIPLTNMLGGTQAAWIKVGIMVGVVATAGCLICFGGIKENHTEEIKQPSDDVKFGEGLKAVLSNKYWVLLTVTTLISITLYSLLGATNVYYARWIFGDENAVAVMGAVIALPTLIGVAIVMPLTKKIGYMKTILYSMFLGVIGVVIRVIAPNNNLTFACIGIALVSFAQLPYSMLSPAMVQDVSEFEEYRSGKRIVGLINSANSFGNKVGSGLASGLTGWILALGGYKEGAVTQSAGAINSIYFLTIWLPGILTVAMIVFMVFYDIDKKYPNFRQELAKRREQAVQ